MSDSLLSGNISFAGLGSGTDFNTLIEGLMKVEQRRVTQLENWRKSWDDKIVQFKELNTKLLSLKTTLEGMNTPGKFLVKTATSSDETVLKATADADAVVGSHSVIVTSLAQNEVELGNKVVNDPATTSLTGASAKIDIQYSTNAADKFSVDVPAGTTLNTLVNLINAHSDNKNKVRAEAVKLTDGDYRLKLVRLDQGADNTLTILGTTTLTDFGPAGFTEKQPAASAAFSVDGIGFTRTSNAVTDAVDGLTFNLRSLGAATVDVAMDAEAVKENVVAFVDAVNEVRTMLIEMTEVDTQTKEGSILTGNYGVQLIGQRLKDIIAQNGLGFTHYDSDTGQGDYYSSLSQLCILTDSQDGSVNKGLLIFDDYQVGFASDPMTFDKAFDANPEAVARLFSAQFDGSTDSAKFNYASCLPTTTKAGTYKVEYTVSGGTVTSATIGGYPANWDSSTNQLTGTYGPDSQNPYPVAGLVISVNDLSTDGTFTGNVSLRQGKVNELIEELAVLTDPKSNDEDLEAGPLAVLEDNYNDIIKSIDTKIEYEERRITRLERQYKDRFARLDAMLGYYNSIASSLQSQIVGMMKE